MGIQTKSYIVGAVDDLELNKYQLELILTEESVDTANNTSNISYELKLHSGSRSFSTWGITRNLTLNGVEIANTTSQMSISAYSTLVLLKGTAIIPHSNDGSLDMPIVASISMPNPNGVDFVVNNATIQSTIQLTKIVRGNTYMPYIYNGSTWVKYTPYIFNGTSWIKYTPRVHDGSSW